MLMPHDRVSVIGTDDQLADFENFLNTFYIPMGQNQPTSSTFTLDQYLVTEKSPFVGRSIRECGIRERTSGLVVGIERQSRRILNPDSSLTIQPGDLLWIVGDSVKLRSI
jgi:CPA2 family monovalent cation:H+ antiporter-2